MKIEMIGSKILRQKAKKVDLPLSDGSNVLINEMIKYIDDSQLEFSAVRSGIGIAAPQIGHSLQMIYINIPENDDQGSFREFLINPKIIGISDSFAALEGGEGCLSVDLDGSKTEGLVHRRFKVIVEAYSYFEKRIVRITKVGYHAIVIQHEMDHLIGKLFLDRINQKDVWKTKTNEVLV